MLLLPPVTGLKNEVGKMERKGENMANRRSQAITKARNNCAENHNLYDVSIERAKQLFLE